MEQHLAADSTFEAFFARARLNRNASSITGVVCGVRLEAIDALVRDTRESSGITQDELALRARVSRRWIADLEAGKPGVGLGKVLRVLAVLQIGLEASGARAGPSETSLDTLLENYDRGVQ